jgi:single-stranded-DNA-specific exonuclease
MYEFASGFDSNNMPKIIISAHEDYHEGIIGLVAAKLVQKYYRPAIVISLNDGFGKGSVRSIPGIDIISVLRKHEDLFINVGGHPMAAGFTIETAKLPMLQERLTQFCSNNFDDSMFEPCIEVDLQIPLGLVNLELAHTLNKLKPFGVGNREPVFLSERVGVAEVNTMGRENNHLALRLYADGGYFKGIAFNNASLATGLGIGDQIDIVYKIKENQFNGNTKLDLIIEDLRKHI